VTALTPWYADVRGALFEELPREAMPARKGPRDAAGLVIEVPVDAGLDTVGAYANGAFRYYNATSGASIVEPDTIPALNDAARDLVRLANGLSAAAVPDGEMKMTVIDGSVPRVCSAEGLLGRLISEKALNAVTLCSELREPGAAVPASPDPQPIVYQFRVTAAATGKNPRCPQGERHRILCWSTTSDEPIGRFFAGYLAECGWSDVTLEKTLAFVATPEWSEPHDPNVVSSFDQALRAGWSVLVFGDPLE
jgi:hypothetical protein